MLDKILSVIARLVRTEVRLSGSLSLSMAEQSYVIETEQETDGRWIAEIPELPGVMAYGASVEEATANAEAIAFRVIADQMEKSKIATSKVSFVAHA